MVKKACERIIHIDGKIAVLIDESTALNGSPALIVHLECETDKTCDPHFMFLVLLELFDQSAESIVLALTKCLHKHGFDYAYLQKNMIHAIGLQNYPKVMAKKKSKDCVSALLN
ncbi:UNVERIFIED_CONTAM: hypothetical protein FKN15_022472 [Acipenser sinensis]